MLRLVLVIFACTTILFGCSSNESEEQVKQPPAYLESDLSYYGEFEIVEEATVQRLLNKESALIKDEVQIVRDPVTGCMYISNNSVYLSLTPFYDKDGKVKGCGETN